MDLDNDEISTAAVLKAQFQLFFICNVSRITPLLSGTSSFLPCRFVYVAVLASKQNFPSFISFYCRQNLQLRKT